MSQIIYLKVSSHQKVKLSLKLKIIRICLNNHNQESSSSSQIHLLLPKQKFMILKALKTNSRELVKFHMRKARAANLNENRRVCSKLKAKEAFRKFQENEFPILVLLCKTLTQINQFLKRKKAKYLPSQVIALVKLLHIISAHLRTNLKTSTKAILKFLT